MSKSLKTPVSVWTDEEGEVIRVIDAPQVQVSVTPDSLVELIVNTGDQIAYLAVPARFAEQIAAELATAAAAVRQMIEAN